MMLKIITISVLTFSASLSAFADNFVVVGKEAKVFDEPNTKSYVTLNTKNQEVVLYPGMVFKSLETSNGWYMIEYSPGLRGYLSEQAVGIATKLPKSGTYPVKNSPTQKLNAYLEDDKWSATVGDKQYHGKAFGNIIIFFDDKQTPAYSLLNLEDNPIVMSYDNKTTNFF
ncbi:MAG: hypothetical protein HDR88_02850 [Bacteroides sp.]|nr:hypothetical protein [Bacteroides sp.]